MRKTCVGVDYCLVRFSFSSVLAHNSRLYTLTLACSYLCPWARCLHGACFHERLRGNFAYQLHHHSAVSFAPLKAFGSYLDQTALCHPADHVAFFLTCDLACVDDGLEDCLCWYASNPKCPCALSIAFGCCYIWASLCNGLPASAVWPCLLIGLWASRSSVLTSSLFLLACRLGVLTPVVVIVIILLLAFF